MSAVPYRGAAITTLLIVLLVTPPAELFHRDGAFVDTRADLRTSDATPIVLSDGLRSDIQDVLPLQLGKYKGVADHSWDANLSKILYYDQLVVRDYVTPGIFYPFQLMVLTARHANAFHDPEVCFSNQGGNVRHAEPTAIHLGGALGAFQVPVGRMVIHYDDAPAKLVYNVYVVETHDAAPDRTTWIRVTLPGVVPSAVDSYDALFKEFIGGVAPYIFHGAGGARTSFEWLGNVAGWPVAYGIGLVAVAPLAGEWIWSRRKEAEEE
ncbi:MAG: EpsI family protein [Euryarchaeota archaeon]|nr:EpsI family protein [Euryarchaeota archaeon]